MRKYNDGQGAAYTAMVAMLLIILAMLCGCNVEKRIAQAKVDAVALDHAQNPCANDTTILTTPGETLVLIDSITTHTTDTLTQTDTLKTTITITKHRTDTVMAVVVDKRLVNDYKDSADKYKRIIANLQGQMSKQDQHTAKVEKQSSTRLIWLLSVLAAILIGIVLWVVIKIRPL